MPLALDTGTHECVRPRMLCWLSHPRMLCWLSHPRMLPRLLSSHPAVPSPRPLTLFQQSSLSAAVSRSLKSSPSPSLTSMIPDHPEQVLSALIDRQVLPLLLDGLAACEHTNCLGLLAQVRGELRALLIGHCTNIKSRESRENE